MGFFVITVQPESGRKADWVGTVRTTVGAGCASVVAVAVKVGVACTWGWQPVIENRIREEAAWLSEK